MPSDYDFVILEIPGLLSGVYPVDLVAKSDISVLVTRANRSWNTADISALERFSKGVDNTPQMILNAARIDSMEEILGELPKKRNKIRRFFKNIVGKNILTKENWQLSES